QLRAAVPGGLEPLRLLRDLAFGGEVRLREGLAPLPRGVGGFLPDDLLDHLAVGAGVVVGRGDLPVELLLGLALGCGDRCGQGADLPPALARAASCRRPSDALLAG